MHNDHKNFYNIPAHTLHVNVHDDCNHHDYHCHHPKIDVFDISKTTQINDPFGNIRYKVCLDTRPIYLEDDTKIEYIVYVLNCFSSSVDFILAYQKFIDRAEAEREFQKLLDNYITLTKAEVLPAQDMHIYDKKTDYQITCPKCCETCIWAKKSNRRHICSNDVSFIECHNPKNVEKIRMNVDNRDDHCCYEHADHNCNCHGHHHFNDKCLHEYGHHDDCHSIEPIFPIVDKFGVCPEYHEAIKPCNTPDITEQK